MQHIYNIIYKIRQGLHVAMNKGVNNKLSIKCNHHLPDKKIRCPDQQKNIQDYDEQ